MTAAFTAAEWMALPLEERHDIEKKSLFLVLDAVEREQVERLHENIHAGRIHGMYSGPIGSDGGAHCGCVIGNLVADHSDMQVAAMSFMKMRDVGAKCHAAPLQAQRDYEDGHGEDELGFHAPIETLAFALRPGDTPENNETAKILDEWVEEWLAAH